jgi:peptidoglycan-associated lipoprotein
MKSTKLSCLVLCGLMVLMAGSGCRKRPKDVTPLPGARTGMPTDAGPGATADTANTIKPEENLTGIVSNPRGSHEGWPQDRETLKSDTVHFDFDSSVVKSSEKSKVSGVADYLKGNAANAVLIEGHCDERGTEEYNRSLGERRALALREELVRLGVDAGRVDTVTFGEDKPAATGHDESAYRQNRRGEFIVLTPK